jgi:hypothetical protein
VIAQDGETVALGGIIVKRDEKMENKVPWLGDLPYLGTLFRYRTQQKQKTELLIIMTPHIVHSRLDADRILAVEAHRMDWVLGDVVKVHGTTGLEPLFPTPPVPDLGAGLGTGADGYPPDGVPASGEAIFPTMPPSGPAGSETLPTPRPIPPIPPQSQGPALPPSSSTWTPVSASTPAAAPAGNTGATNWAWGAANPASTPTTDGQAAPPAEERKETERWHMFQKKS